MAARIISFVQRDRKNHGQMGLGIITARAVELRHGQMDRYRMEEVAKVATMTTRLA